MHLFASTAIVCACKPARSKHIHSLKTRLVHVIAASTRHRGTAWSTLESRMWLHCSQSAFGHPHVSSEASVRTEVMYVWQGEICTRARAIHSAHLRASPCTAAKPDWCQIRTHTLWPWHVCSVLEYGSRDWYLPGSREYPVHLHTDRLTAVSFCCTPHSSAVDLVRLWCSHLLYGLHLP